MQSEQVSETSDPHSPETIRIGGGGVTKGGRQNQFGGQLISRYL